MKFAKAFAFATVLSSAALIGASAQAAATTYTIDPVHSSVGFKVRHFFNQVSGSFSKFEGTVTYDKDNAANNKASATIQIASVNTLNADRDAHLQRDDFFNAERFPAITYESTSWKKTAENTYEVQGNLSFHGETKPVVLEVKYLGSGEGAGYKAGKTVIGFSAKGKINREDWGVKGGAPVVGEEVDIDLSVQAQN